MALFLVVHVEAQSRSSLRALLWWTVKVKPGVSPFLSWWAGDKYNNDTWVRVGYQGNWSPGWCPNLVHKNTQWVTFRTEIKVTDILWIIFLILEQNREKDSMWVAQIHQHRHIPAPILPMFLFRAGRLLCVQHWDKCGLLDFSLAVEKSHSHRGWVPCVWAPYCFINSSEGLVSGDCSPRCVNYVVREKQCFFFFLK